MILYIPLIVAYLIGSLSFAIIISKFMKMDDPRSYGSQNAGATNVMRSGNKKAAALTLLGDLLKGLIVVILARIVTRRIDGGDAIVGICGVMAVIGHIYPIFFKFKGGKGVATAVGVMLGFSPVLAGLLALSWFVVFKVSRVSSLAAILATLLSPLYAYYLMGNSSYFGATTIIAFFVVYKHKDNIIRLFRGTEHRFKKDQSSSDLARDAPDTKPVVSNRVAKDANYYAVLGVAHTASVDEIKIAYHSLAQNILPEDEGYNAEAEDTTPLLTLQRIETAYETLIDPKLRAVYDEELFGNLHSSEAND